MWTNQECVVRGHRPDGFTERSASLDGQIYRVPDNTILPSKDGRIDIPGHPVAQGSNALQPYFAGIYMSIAGCGNASTDSVVIHC